MNLVNGNTLPFHIPKLRLHWLQKLIPLVLIGIAVHLLLPQITELEHSWQVLRQMSWWLLTVAVIMQIFSYVGSGVLLQGLAQLAGGRLSLMRGMIITLASSSIGIVAAGIVGSTAAAYSWLCDIGINEEGAGLAATLKSLFNNGVLLILTILGAVHLLVDHDLTRVQIGAFSVVLLVLVGFIGALWWGALHPAPLRRWLLKVALRWDTLRRGTEQGGSASHQDIVWPDHFLSQLQNAWIILRAGGWHRPLLGSVLNIGFDSLTVYFLFWAGGYDIGFGVLLTGYALPLLLGKAGFVPGGIGIVEATMTAIYTSLGIPAQIVVVVILGYRLFSFWVPAALGFPLAAYLQRLNTVQAGTDAHT